MSEEQKDDIGFMKPERAARYLGVSRRYITILMDRGDLPYSRLGPKCILFSRADIDDLVKRHRVDPSGELA